MWYFLIKTVPRGDDAKQFGGAYVNCWINFQREDGAQQLALFYLEKEGWRIEGVEETKSVGRETYEENSDSLVYFNEAEQDGCSFVVNTWPTNGEDEDDDLTTQRPKAKNQRPN